MLGRHNEVCEIIFLALDQKWALATRNLKQFWVGNF